MSSPIRFVTALAIGSAALLLTGLVVLFATQHRAAAKAPDYRVVRVGDIDYEAMQGRPLHPANRVDRAILGGRPRVHRGGMLFGAFISATNASSAPRPTAARIVLRDQAGHVYRPLPLAAANPYAYTRRVLRGGVRVPALGSVADDNLAAGGKLLVFRIPAKAYADSQALELVIHDRAGTASLII